MEFQVKGSEEKVCWFVPRLRLSQLPVHCGGFGRGEKETVILLQLHKRSVQPFLSSVFVLTEANS